MLNFLWQMIKRAFFITLISGLSLTAYIATAIHAPTSFRILKRGSESIVSTIEYLFQIDPAYINLAEELGLNTKLVLMIYMIAIYVILSWVGRLMVTTGNKITSPLKRKKKVQATT